ncbi:MAG: hypothetical protein H0W88_05215 [Parachlamydiaceae bacterium]|nr:hypothetical protein [Parachlamydiaceae bacterium]
MTDIGGWVLLLAFAILITFFSLVALFWYSYWFTHRTHSLSPYTGLPLRRATELSYYASERVWIYLKDLHQYDNRPFQFNRAAYCRETGRIFINCVTLFDTIRVDWNFLQKRYPGSYISWGSLNSYQQEAIRDAHESLAGYQTEISSPEPAPRAIGSDFTVVKPGPLYVDLDSKILLGWKQVPDTNLEVLIVQFPKKRAV